MSLEKIACRGVVELTTVVTLQVLDCGVELSGDKGKEIFEGGESVGLVAKGECPHIMSKII